jgi:hypothetical protein
LPTINDYKKQALNNAGYTGDINTAESKWLKTICAPYKGAIQDMWRYALRQAGYTGSVSDMQNQMLSDLGYTTGALPNKWYKYWRDTPMWGFGLANTVLAGIEWNRITYPINLTKVGDTWETDFDRDDYLPDSTFVNTYYVDVATGNNSNNGLTVGTKKKSIHSALTAGNATGQPYKVIITAGLYTRGDGLSNSGSVKPTQSCAIVATGGRVVTGTFDDLSWPGSPDGTFTNCYKVSRSNVGEVYNIAANDVYGDYDQLLKVADAATCDSTPGSWAQVGSDLYVHRADAAAVTNANTRANLTIDHFTITSFDNKRIYMYGIDMEGGFNGGGWCISGVSNTVVIAENCSFKYAGTFATSLDCVAITSSTGLFVFKDCLFAKSSKDGLNVHYSPAGVPRRTFILTEGCTSRNHGKGASTSNNGLTGHENVPFLDVESRWEYGRGGVVRFINNSRLGAFGSRAAFDLQDSTGEPPIIWHTINTAKFWLVDCEGEGANDTDYVLNAFSGTTIYIHEFNLIKGQVNGNIVPFLGDAYATTDYVLLQGKNADSSHTTLRGQTSVSVYVDLAGKE